MTNIFLIDVWKDKGNRRAIFEEYARVKGFDPLEADNWYGQPRSAVTALKVQIIKLGYYYYFINTIF